MSLLDFSDLYNLISRGTENVATRKEVRGLRKVAFQSATTGQGFNKVAFDTRRIDQETTYNPRRGLQNYNRSEEFVSQALEQKIVNFANVRNVLVGLKERYGKQPEWQDSNARVLLSTLDKGLRADVNDGDFAESQPGVGSFDYIEELMHVRYRLGFDDLTSMTESDLRKVILSKDEELTRKNARQALEISKTDVSKMGYDSLLEKLFSDCKASAENPDVERTISITIRDRFHKES